MSAKQFTPSEESLFTVSPYELNEDGEAVFEVESVDDHKGQKTHKFSVPFVLPFEKAKVEIPCLASKKRMRFKNVYLKEIQKRAERRKEPVCKHFTSCGGCLLQHMDDKYYKEYKKSLVTQEFNKHKLNPFVIEDPVFVSPQTRRRANLDFVAYDDDFFLGFHAYKRHSVVSFEECFTLTKELRDLVLSIRPMLKGILPVGARGKLFLLQSDINNGAAIDCALEIQHHPELSENEFTALESWAKGQSNLFRLTYRYRKVHKVVFEQSPDLFTVDIDGCRVPATAYAFLQATDQSQNLLIDWAKEAIINIQQKNLKVLDLFCGRGTFSIPLAKLKGHVDVVHSVEFEQQPLEVLASVAQEYDLPITTEKMDLVQNPLPESEVAKYDVVVLDPPRRGAFEQVSVIKKMRHKPPYVIYISCSTQTFAKDAKELLDSGYTLESVKPLDQFLWTPHLELFGVFVNKNK